MLAAQLLAKEVYDLDPFDRSKVALATFTTHSYLQHTWLILVGMPFVLITLCAGHRWPSLVLAPRREDNGSQDIKTKLILCCTVMISHPKLFSNPACAECTEEPSTF